MKNLYKIVICIIAVLIVILSILINITISTKVSTIIIRPMETDSQFYSNFYIESKDYIYLSNYNDITFDEVSYAVWEKLENNEVIVTSDFLQDNGLQDLTIGDSLIINRNVRVSNILITIHGTFKIKEIKDNNKNVIWFSMPYILSNYGSELGVVNFNISELDRNFISLFKIHSIQEKYNIQFDGLSTTFSYLYIEFLILFLILILLIVFILKLKKG